MKQYLSIDLGGTIIKVGLVSGGCVIDSTRVAAESDRGLLLRLPAIYEAVGKLSGHTQEIAGVCMAFPGIVDFPNRKVLATNAKYDDAPSADIAGWVSRHWGVPLVIDNDARMAMIGEWMYGAGRGTENMVMMTIGTGIGTGVVVDGHPLYGANGCAGSLGGHLTVDYKGRLCTCGNKGCVESMGSSFFLPKIIAEDTRLSQFFRSQAPAMDFKRLTDGYRTGDLDCRIVVEECMDVWAAAIVNYIHAYDPEKVVIGGGIMRSADIILPRLRQKVYSLAWMPNHKAELCITQLGDDAALVAADYYFEK